MDLYKARCSWCWLWHGYALDFGEEGRWLRPRLSNGWLCTWIVLRIFALTGLARSRLVSQKHFEALLPEGGRLYLSEGRIVVLDCVRKEHILAFQAFYVPSPGAD